MSTASLSTLVAHYSSREILVILLTRCL